MLISFPFAGAVRLDQPLARPGQRRPDRAPGQAEGGRDFVVVEPFRLEQQCFPVTIAQLLQRRADLLDPFAPIERFVGLLAETPYRWRLTAQGKMRAHLGSTEMCVITGAVRYRTGVRFSIGDWVRAAEVLGLSYAEAGRLVAAADDIHSPEARTRHLRDRLLVAGRVGRSAPAPDAMLEREPRVLVGA